MEQRGNKTIMCSVFFLDIVEYSKKSVSGQIALRERFNAFLSKAIQDIPVNDRIILDTGDGAAISFLGDVEDALQAALAMRECLAKEGMQMEPPLLVRMGINLGPVRLVKDINGQPNIVGDGINVAQRVMSFADANQLLVSRSYYDAVSRLSPEYAGMFHYQGSRTDKHVRDHEVYAIGYPGEFTATQERYGDGGTTPPTESQPGALKEQIRHYWQTSAQCLSAGAQTVKAAFRNAPPSRRAAYAGILAVSAIVLVLLLVKLTSRGVTPPHQMAETSPAQSNGEQPASEVVATTTVNPPAVTAEKKPGIAGKKLDATGKKPDVTTKKPDAAGKKPDTTASKPDVSSSKPDAIVKKPDVSGNKPDAAGNKPDMAHKEPVAAKKAAQDNERKEPASTKENLDQKSREFISVRCNEGSGIYLDGRSKGKTGATPLVMEVDPGKHLLAITHPSNSTVKAEDVTVKAGETVQLRPSFCN